MQSSGMRLRVGHGSFTGYLDNSAVGNERRRKRVEGATREWAQITTHRLRLMHDAWEREKFTLGVP